MLYLLLYPLLYHVNPTEYHTSIMSTQLNITQAELDTLLAADTATDTPAATPKKYLSDFEKGKIGGCGCRYIFHVLALVFLSFTMHGQPRYAR